MDWLIYSLVYAQVEVNNTLKSMERRRGRALPLQAMHRIVVEKRERERKSSVSSSYACGYAISIPIFS